MMVEKSLFFWVSRCPLFSPHIFLAQNEKSFSNEHKVPVQAMAREELQAPLRVSGQDVQGACQG
jgi:hypothetical protein